MMATATKSRQDWIDWGDMSSQEPVETYMCVF